MQREQKAIVLSTKEYCAYCVKNKGGIIVLGLGFWISVRVRVRRRCEMQGKGTCDHGKSAKKTHLDRPLRRTSLGLFSVGRRARQSRFFFTFSNAYDIPSMFRTFYPCLGHLMNIS